MTREQAITKLALHLMQCGMLMPIEWIDKNGEGSDTMLAFNMAMQALREKQEWENPKPLTLDELREVDGEPVWFEDDEEETNNGWCIWSASHTRYWIDENKEIGNYGETWLVYRNKPGEVEP